MANTKVQVEIEGVIKTTADTSAAERKLRELHARNTSSPLIGNGNPVPSEQSNQNPDAPTLVDQAEKMGEVIGDKVAEKVGDELASAGSAIGDKVAEKLGEQAGAIGEQVGQKAAESIGNKIADQLGGQAEKMGSEVGKQAAEVIGEKVSQKLGEKAPEIGEEIGNKAGEVIGDKVAEKLGEQAEKIGEQVGKKAADAINEATKSATPGPAHNFHNATADRVLTSIEAALKSQSLSQKDVGKLLERLNRAEVYVNRSSDSSLRGRLDDMRRELESRVDPVQGAGGGGRGGNRGGRLGGAADDDDRKNFVQRLGQWASSQAARATEGSVANVLGKNIGGLLGGTLGGVLGGPVGWALGGLSAAGIAFNAADKYLEEGNKIARDEVIGFADLGRQYGYDHNTMRLFRDQRGWSMERFREQGFDAKAAAQVAAEYDRPGGRRGMDGTMNDVASMLTFSRSTGINEHKVAAIGKELTGMTGGNGNLADSLRVLKLSMSEAIKEGLSGSENVQALVNYARMQYNEGRTVNNQTLAWYAGLQGKLNASGTPVLQGERGASIINRVVKGATNPQDPGLEFFLLSNLNIPRDASKAGITDPRMAAYYNRLSRENPLEAGRFLMERMASGQNPAMFYGMLKNFDQSLGGRTDMQSMFYQKVFGLSRTETAEIISKYGGVSEAFRLDPEYRKKLQKGQDLTDDSQGGNARAQATLTLRIAENDRELIKSLAKLKVTGDLEEMMAEVKNTFADLQGWMGETFSTSESDKSWSTKKGDVDLTIQFPKASANPLVESQKILNERKVNPVTGLNVSTAAIKHLKNFVQSPQGQSMDAANTLRKLHLDPQNPIPADVLKGGEASINKWIKDIRTKNPNVAGEFTDLINQSAKDYVQDLIAIASQRVDNPNEAAARARKAYITGDMTWLDPAKRKIVNLDQKRSYTPVSDYAAKTAAAEASNLPGEKPHETMFMDSVWAGEGRWNARVPSTVEANWQKHVGESAYYGLIYEAPGKSEPEARATLLGKIRRWQTTYEKQFKKPAIKDGQYTEDFLVWFGKKYAPSDAANDPQGLNNHWIGNVGGYMTAMGWKPGGFKSGGYTGSGPRDAVAGVVHHGEFVVPAEYAPQVIGAMNKPSGPAGDSKVIIEFRGDGPSIHVASGGDDAFIQKVDLLWQNFLQGVGAAAATRNPGATQNQFKGLRY